MGSSTKTEILIGDVLYCISDFVYNRELLCTLCTLNHVFHRVFTPRLYAEMALSSRLRNLGKDALGLHVIGTDLPDESHLRNLPMNPYLRHVSKLDIQSPLPPHFIRRLLRKMPRLQEFTAGALDLVTLATLHVSCPLLARLHLHETPSTASGGLLASAKDEDTSAELTSLRSSNTVKLPPFRNLRALALENLTAPDLGDLALEVACILAGSPDLEELTMSLAKPVFSRPSAWAASQGSQPDPMDSRGLDWMDFFATAVDEFSRLLALESSEEQQPAKLRLRYLSVGHGIVLNPGGRFYGYSPPTILSLKLPDSGADWPADTGISADPTPLRTLSKLTSLARLERLHLRTNAPLVLGWAQLLPLYNEDALACISPATAPMLEELAVAAYSPTVAETLMRYSAFGRRGLVVRVDGSDGEVCGADEPWKDINGSTMGDLLLRRREVGGGSGGEGLRVAGMEGLMAWPRPSCVGRHENGLPDMNAVDESIRAVPYGGSNLTSDIDEERARVVSTLVRTWSSLRSLHVLIPKYWPRERRSHTSRVDTSYNLSLLEAVLMRPEMRGLLALRVTIESEDVPMAWAGNNITADVASRLAYASGRLRYVATNTLAWRIWRDETSFRLEELDASEQRVIRLLEETRTLGVRTRPAEDVEEYNWWPG